MVVDPLHERLAQVRAQAARREMSVPKAVYRAIQNNIKRKKRTAYCAVLL